jgi:type IV secretion system protein VirB10
MNSDLPGDVRGIVRENVYDTVTGKYLLIPQGSRVIGTYNSRITYGQRGLQVIWTRLIFPDGSSIDLGGLNGEDVRGLSGFRDKVNNHYGKLFAIAALTSVFAAGVELSQRQNGGNIYTGTPTVNQTISASVGQQIGQLGTTLAERQLNVQPTVTIPIGYRFNIRVRKDLIFDAPYADRQAVWK